MLISLDSPQAKGLGYAMNTAEELKFVGDIAEATGVVLDPVYRYTLSCRFAFSYRRAGQGYVKRKLF